jgi:hypothetical protein
MSHPANKHARVDTGRNKSRSRVHGKQDPRRFRNTTKLCSCYMCGNPRKYFEDITMQEKRQLSKEATML